MSRALWLPPNGSLHGALLDRLLEWNLAALTALLVLAHLVLIYAIMRRHRPSASFRARTQASGGTNLAVSPIKIAPLSTSHPPLLPTLRRAQTVAALFCCLLFAAMAITSERLWAALRYEGASPAARQVEVVGVQFQWYFRYPGPDARFGSTQPRLVSAAAGNPLGIDPADSHSADDIVSSVLLLPAGREADLRLRAHDVIHGFFIPGMRLKQNAVPGLVLHVHFTPATPGTYPILCTQVCGSGHARMQAVLRVLPPEQFEAWLAERERASLAAQQGRP